jgi:hypothetical protein
VKKTSMKHCVTVLVHVVEWLGSGVVKLNGAILTGRMFQPAILSKIAFAMMVTRLRQQPCQSGHLPGCADYGGCELLELRGFGGELGGFFAERFQPIGRIGRIHE